jgi:serine/threonine protein kinase
MSEPLTFRRVTGGEPETHDVSYGDTVEAGNYLVGRTVRFDTGLELRQHRPMGVPQRPEGYERLDNEILAGRQLHALADWSYPTQVTSLYGDEANSADPFALFEPYRGRPLREAGLYMGDDEFHEFLTGLLTGLCWIAAAGVAHRTISPDTVLWDASRGVMISDFSRSTIFGIPRTVLKGYDGWVPRELRQGSCTGAVGPHDDIWAAGRLIFFVRNQGEEPQDRSQLADLDAIFNGMFNRVLGPAETRPTARELLEDGLRRQVNVPSGARRSDELKAGREIFLKARERKHQSAVVTPPDFNTDLDWMADAAACPATPVNGDHAATAVTSPADDGSALPPISTNGDPVTAPRGEGPRGGTSRFWRKRGGS